MRNASILLRAAGAVIKALPAAPGVDLQGFVIWVLQLAGFENGTVNVPSRLLPLLAGLRLSVITGDR